MEHSPQGQFFEPLVEDAEAVTLSDIEDEEELFGNPESDTETEGGQNQTKRKGPDFTQSGLLVHEW